MGWEKGLEVTSGFEEPTSQAEIQVRASSMLGRCSLGCAPNPRATNLFVLFVCLFEMGSHSVPQAGVQLMAVFLPQLSEHRLHT